MHLRVAVLAVAAGIVVIACARPAAPAEPAVVAPPELPSSSTATPAGPKTAISGATIDVDTKDGSASYTVGNWRPVPADAQIIAAKGAMYSVDVRVIATGGTVAVNGFYFTARTADGAMIAPAVGAVRPGITYSRLTAGQTVEGHIAFDIAPGTAVMGVGLRDATGRPLAFWSLSADVPSR